MNDYYIKDLQSKIDSIDKGFMFSNPKGISNIPDGVVNIECYGDVDDKPIFGATTEHGFQYVAIKQNHPMDTNEWRITCYRKPINQRDDGNELNIQVISKEPPTEHTAMAWIQESVNGLPDKGKRWFAKNIDISSGHANIIQVMPSNMPFGMVFYNPSF